ncbi:MAG: hypothetical protein ACYSTF_08060 [Planctomycetota bacterium]
MGVVGIPCLVCVPFVFCEARVIFGIDDGELALGEWDSAEGVAEAEAAVGEYEAKGEPFEAGWNFDSDEDNQDGPLLLVVRGPSAMREPSIIG